MLNHIRYEKTNYIFGCNSKEADIILHPAQPDSSGKVFQGVQNGSGAYFFHKMID